MEKLQDSCVQSSVKPESNEDSDEKRNILEISVTCSGVSLAEKPEAASL